jgi:hypothetical protein
MAKGKYNRKESSVLVKQSVELLLIMISIGSGSYINGAKDIHVLLTKMIPKEK